MTVTISGSDGVTTPIVNSVTENVTTLNVGQAVVSASGVKFSDNTIQKSSAFGNMEVITASQPFYAIPATKIKVTVIGGGGGSGGAATAVPCVPTASAGGGGGGTAIQIFSGLTVGATLNIVVGAGGTAGSSAGSNGGTGGTSSVSSGTQSIPTISATGGGPSKGNNSGINVNNYGGIGVGGSINMAGMYGTPLISTGNGGWGGASFFGGGGNPPDGSGITSPGRTYGGGAGGAQIAINSSAGAAGAAGVVIVEY